MKLPDSIIIAVPVAMLLASWHGFFGLSVGIDQLLHLSSPFLLLEQGYGERIALDASITIAALLAALSRMIAAGLLAVGTVQLLRAHSLTPMLSGASLALLAHSLAWLAECLFWFLHPNQAQQTLIEWAERSMLPSTLLTPVLAWAPLAGPISLLANTLLLAVASALTLLVIRNVRAEETASWMAVYSEEPLLRLSSPAAAPQPQRQVSTLHADEECTQPELHAPLANHSRPDPDGEATEMVTGDDLQAMLIQAVEEAAAERNASTDP